MRKAITLKDVARETGVHISTVSRALDPNARTSLKPEVVQRVREAAHRLGYRPNRMASGLRTNRTMTVGIMIPDITNMIFPPIVRGIEHVLEPLGYAAIIVNTDNMTDREERLVDVLRERGVDGIVHAAVLRDDPKILETAAEGTPVVTVNRRIERATIPAVVNDEGHGIRLLMRHLSGMGHRRIAHIGGPEESSTGQVRTQRFRAEVRELGLDLPPEGVVTAARYHEEEGAKAALRLLDGGWPFTAILCANDRLALGAISALQARGLRCPEDISVTGFNDMPFLDLIPPGLTTVRIQLAAVGQFAARILVELMTDRSAAVPSETVMPVELVRRGSVAVPGNR